MEWFFLMEYCRGFMSPNKRSEDILYTIRYEIVKYLHGFNLKNLINCSAGIVGITTTFWKGTSADVQYMMNPSFYNRKLHKMNRWWILLLKIWNDVTIVFSVRIELKNSLKSKQILEILQQLRFDNEMSPNKYKKG